jgi:DNA recombination protein RmuC
MDTATVTPFLLVLLLGVVLGALIGALWARSRGGDEQALTALEQRAADTALVRDGLDRLAEQMTSLETHRASWQVQLHEQVEGMRHLTDSLRRETGALAQALRRPQVRGQWGEMHLRRAVELAGLVDRCDFTEQARLDGGAMRPDLVVHLPGGRSVVVDAKVPLDALLDAGEADDEDERAAHLRRHVRQIRTHVDALSAKAYWRSLPGTPEFVVMFVPAESFLSAALEVEADLLDHAASRKVVLATPTTLIALLRTVAQGWTHERLADQTAEVQRLGRDLHERLATLGAHVDKVGRSLASAVTAYNRAVGSLEGRVLVTARRFGGLGIEGDELEPPAILHETTRRLSAPEFAALEELADPRARPDQPLEQPGPPPARRAHGA